MKVQKLNADRQLQEVEMDHGGGRSAQSRIVTAHQPADNSDQSTLLT